MTSTTYNPSYDQSKKINQQAFYTTLTQQVNSLLSATGVIEFVPTDGSAYNVPRLARADLVEVATRNPDKQYAEFMIDNRRFTKTRFTRTYTVDAKFDINEAVADPTSPLMGELMKAVNRQIDRSAVAAAVGSVLVGAPDTAGSTISAATDGVITVNSTAGLTYDRIRDINQNFINNEVMYGGSCLGLTGRENNALMGEVEFISNDFISSKPVETGKMENVSGYRVAMFAGSATGTGTLTNPILPETTTTRKCPVMAPGAVIMQMEVAKLDVMPNPNKVNSNDITVDLIIGAMRKEGVLVQILSTTI